MNMKGKSTAELLEMNPDNLSAADLRKVVSRIASAGNKRLKRLAEEGVYSHAADVVMESGGKFSVKGKTEDELRAEFMREKDFFERKTSSLRGVHQIQKETVKTLESRGVTKIDKDRIGEAFALYDKLKKRDPSVSIAGLKYSVINAIMEMPASLDFEDKILAMQEQLADLYEEYDEIYTEFDGLSEFFPI